ASAGTFLYCSEQFPTVGHRRHNSGIDEGGGLDARDAGSGDRFNKRHAPFKGELTAFYLKAFARAVFVKNHVAWQN
ncbi:MAG TPA: hypothetical protein QF861_18640, partial [Alphaproteobacteria bacterium]|nr:hypothetical protein [Alphaproteobacteria bacterium]